MRRLRLDFLHPSPRPHWAGWLLLAVGLGAAGWAGVRGEEAERALKTAIAEAPASTATAAPRTAGHARGNAADNAAAAARAQLDAPWGDLFVRLETARVARIALLSLEADARRPEATLMAEARTVKDMFGWIEKLKDESGFASVVLASHAVQANDPQQPVRFVLRLRWRS